jgi:hypothetical protein
MYWFGLLCGIGESSQVDSSGVVSEVQLQRTDLSAIFIPRLCIILLILKVCNDGTSGNTLLCFRMVCSCCMDFFGNSSPPLH